MVPAFIGMPGTTRVNLLYPVPTLGSHREWRGQPVHATSGIPLESYRSNTGEPARDVKEDGE